MMAKKKLIIYDDEKTHAERYLKTLKEIKKVDDSYDVISYDNDDFLKIYKTLKERRKKSREGDQDWGEIEIDNSALAIIDYDLIEAQKEIPENGEEIVYYLRMFSTCGYNILLNRYGRIDRKTFDLDLTGHIDSHADINIGMKDLKNLGLWTGLSEGYRPWYWPSLLSIEKKVSNRVSDVLKNLQKSIKEFFNLDDSFFYSLPKSSLRHLGMESKNIEDTTFEHFFVNSDLIFKGRDKEGNFSDNMKAQIVASRLSKWFERTVMPGQDVLVDCPHLVSRFPSLLKDTKIETWNNTTLLDNIDDLPIKKGIIEKYRFKKDYWLSRPCWIWDPLTECNDILEVSEPWKKEEVPYVFAEDASSFYLEEKCRGFVSDVDSPFRKRYVKHYSDVEYRPKVRLYVE